MPSAREHKRVNMGWRPIHEAHAIERVRLIAEFSSPLTVKLLNKCAQRFYDAAESLGFDTKERVPGNVAPGFSISLNGFGPNVTDLNGYVMKRHSGGLFAEEVGFRENSFGYVTTEYSRWQNFESRLGDVLLPGLYEAAQYTDIASLRLEYWDRFKYEGPPTEADARALLSSFDETIPLNSVQGRTLWHSHAGWFEEFEGTHYLINRNLDANDFQDSDGSMKRCLAVYTFVEARLAGQDVSEAELKRHLAEMHRRSVLMFGSAITEKVRAQIGLKLEVYKNG